VWAVSHGCRKRKRERERGGGGGGGEGEREEGKRGREGTCEGGGRGEQRKEATRTMRRKLGRERERERERENARRERGRTRAKNESKKERGPAKCARVPCAGNTTAHRRAEGDCRRPRIRVVESRERDEESAARKGGGTEWEDWVRGPRFEDPAGSGGYLPRFLAPS